MKFSECCELFLSYIADKSPNTIKNYSVDLKQFIKIVGDKEVELVSKSDVAKFRMVLQSQRKKSSTIARKLATLNSFYQYLIDLELVKVSPITKSHRPKISQRIPSSLSNEEIKTLLKNIDNLQDKAIVVLLLTTGLRSSELLNIKKSNILIERQGQTFSVDKAVEEGLKEDDIAYIRVVGKGDKEREVPITGRPLQILLEYLKEVTPYIDSKTPIFPISYHTLWRKIKDIGKKIAISLHPHKLRHTAATVALASGAELRVIQELLGHASPITTARYAKVGQKQLLKATKALSENIDL
ncbi:tyrosine-type recombinase/integrase [Sulfurihydrogenibium subterraneum]|uniref:tyrosine-type recombinase/integrase n=1 Tax=Sulfurihydrogenibium subterraneum TaxID=171121 RepID=UPI00048DFA28|nr:tyrosine-type recombinase/integrase [Sulfurihydrogenibium subterraneum]